MAKKQKKISTNKAVLGYVGENLMIKELDKDNCVINEISFNDFIADFINVEGISISIGFSEEI